MELRFMGQAYTTANRRVATVATEQTASFKGQKYQIRVPVQSIKSQPNREARKYRGVTYTVEADRSGLDRRELKPCC